MSSVFEAQHCSGGCGGGEGFYLITTSVDCNLILLS